MAAPYDTVTVHLNAARVRLNDVVKTLDPVGGKILENTQPFTQQATNSAYRKFQRKLADLGYSRLNVTGATMTFVATVSTDPAVFSYLGWDGFFNGTTLYPTPALPADFISPLDLWERQSGTNAEMTEMDQILNGLPVVTKKPWNRSWEWQNDRIQFPGATVVTEVRMRYAAFLPDFVDVTSAPGTYQVIGPWFSQPVPIVQSLDPLSLYIAWEFAAARAADGNQGMVAVAAMLQQMAEDSTMQVLNRDTARMKAISKRSEYTKMADRFTPNQGPDTQPIKRP